MINIKKNKAIFFDVDGTLISEKSTWQYLHKKLGTTPQAIRNKDLYDLGKISFEEWGHYDAMLWKNFEIKKVKEILHSMQLVNDARDIMHDLRKKGFFIGIISSSFTILIDRISKELDIDISVANILGCRNGRLTGNVEMIVTDKNKGFHLEKICKEINILPRQSIAVGDSKFDIGMFRKVGFCIAFNSNDSQLEKEARVTVRSRSLRDIIPPIDDWFSKVYSVN